MSPPRKFDTPRRTRRTHAARRHRAGATSSSNPPPALTRRHLSNTDACRAVEEWAFGSKEAALDYSLAPVFRVGVVAWLARVALQPEERAA